MSSWTLPLRPFPLCPISLINFRFLLILLSLFLSSCTSRYRFASRDIKWSFSLPWRHSCYLQSQSKFRVNYVLLISIHHFLSKWLKLNVKISSQPIQILIICKETALLSTSLEAYWKLHYPIYPSSYVRISFKIKFVISAGRESTLIRTCRCVLSTLNDTIKEQGNHCVFSIILHFLKCIKWHKKIVELSENVTHGKIAWELLFQLFNLVSFQFYFPYTLR